MTTEEMKPQEASTGRCASDPHATVCTMWEHEGRCLPLLSGEAGPERTLTAHDICAATYALARTLGVCCKKNCAARTVQSCPPLFALDRMLRLLAERQMPRANAVDDPSKEQEQFSLGDLVHRAVNESVQDPMTRANLTARLIQAFTANYTKGRGESSAQEL